MDETLASLCQERWAWSWLRAYSCNYVTCSRAKITSDLAQVIDDGLYHYEEDLWHDFDDEPEPWVRVPFNLLRLLHLKYP